MALKKCPSCKKDVSDKASSCPNCGEPIRPNSGGAFNLHDPVHLMGGVICFFIAAYFIIRIYNSIAGLK